MLIEFIHPEQSTLSKNININIKDIQPLLNKIIEDITTLSVILSTGYTVNSWQSKVFNILKENTDEEITIDDIVNKLGLSRRQATDTLLRVHRRYKKVYKVNTGTYIYRG